MKWCSSLIILWLAQSEEHDVRADPNSIPKALEMFS